MKALGVFLVVSAFAIVGCGGGSVATNDEGAELVAGLASADVHDTRCPAEGGTYSRGEWEKPDARMRRSGSPVILENLTAPQRFRTSPGKPWVTKAPIAVRLDGKPVELAVMDGDGAEVGLLYDEWPREYSPEVGYDRIRFLPCKDDPRKPTWYGWPGSIIANRENVCLKLAVREADGATSVQRVSLGDGCPEAADR